MTYNYDDPRLLNAERILAEARILYDFTRDGLIESEAKGDVLMTENFRIGLSLRKYELDRARAIYAETFKLIP
jgi:hypothetical protein